MIPDHPADLLVGLLCTGLGVVVLYGLWADFKRGATRIPRGFARTVERNAKPVSFWMTIAFQFAVYSILFWFGISELLLASGVAQAWPLISVNF